MNSAKANTINLDQQSLLGTALRVVDINVVVLLVLVLIISSQLGAGIS